MNKKYTIMVIACAVLIGGVHFAAAQETMQLRAVTNTRTNLRVSPEPETPTIVVSDTTPVFETSTPTPSPVITVTSGSTEFSTITCIKTTTGSCILYSCSDGTKTNTCDLMCKTTKPADPSLVGAVVTDEPKITSFFPESGNAGTQVRVYLTKGQKAFSGPDSIEIGGVKAKMILFGNVPGSKADFYTDIIVPEGAKTGKITITKPQTFAKSGSSDADFVVIPTQDAPFITSIKPIAGYPGQEVIVEYYMGTKTFSGLDSIEIGGVPVVTKMHSDVWAKKPHGYMEKIIIPDNAKSGKITLNKKNFGSVSSKDDFIVTAATDAPTILSFSPTGGSPGDEIILKVVAGKKNFSAPDAIYIGEVKAEIVKGLTDTTGIRTYTIRVPENAKTGKIIFRKPGAFVDVATVTDFQVYGAVKSFFHKVGNFFKGK
ncbi:MAG: hypothetical protein WCG20_01645 [bacterium]